MRLIKAPVGRKQTAMAETEAGPEGFDYEKNVVTITFRSVHNDVPKLYWYVHLTRAEALRLAAWAIEHTEGAK